MSTIFRFFDDHMEVLGAVAFGVIAIGACMAVAGALAGAL